MIWSISLVIIGALMLATGGNFLTTSSVSLALKLKIPSLVIGLTIVSFATSAPELFVSVQSALDGNTDITLGNIIGSNIANISLIVGIVAVFFYMPLDFSNYRQDFWWMMSITTFFYMMLLAFEGISRFTGILLILILIVYGYSLIKSQYRKRHDHPEKVSEGNIHMPYWKIFTLLIGSAVVLKFGADFFLMGASDIAIELGLSQRIIALTLVAVGTSLPELAASIVAAYKKESDISMGNILGSNIYNILAVGGITAIIKPIELKSNQTLTVDLPVLFVVSLALFAVMQYGNHKRISRPEGFILLSLYVGYIAYIFF